MPIAPYALRKKGDRNQEILFLSQVGGHSGRFSAWGVKKNYGDIFW
jgi:hypothetical protein